MIAGQLILIDTPGRHDIDVEGGTVQAVPRPGQPWLIDVTVDGQALGLILEGADKRKTLIATAATGRQAFAPTRHAACKFLYDTHRQDREVNTAA